MNKKVIYTTITTGYDDIQQPLVIYDDFDYICFTNDVNQKKIGVWEIRPIPFKTKDSIRLSRYVKLLPHKVLSEYEYSCYIDMNVIVKSNVLKECIDGKIEHNEIISLPVHPSGRDCLYKEARKIIEYDKDNIYDVVRQVHFLHKEGYPYNNGLFENNIIFRKHMDKKIIMVSEMWWQIFCKYSHRDQLSLVYVLWKFNIKATSLFPANISTLDNNNFVLTNHNKYKLPPTLIRRIKYSIRRYKRNFVLKYCEFLLE